MIKFEISIVFMGLKYLESLVPYQIFGSDFRFFMLTRNAEISQNYPEIWVTARRDLGTYFSIARTTHSLTGPIEGSDNVLFFCAAKNAVAITC